MLIKGTQNNSIDLKNPILIQNPNNCIKDKVDQSIKLKEIPLYITFLISGISASVAKTTTAPIERIKLILQNQSYNHQIAKNPSLQYNGIQDCFIRIVRNEGSLA